MASIVARCSLLLRILKVYRTEIHSGYIQYTYRGFHNPRRDAASSCHCSKDVSLDVSTTRDYSRIERSSSQDDESPVVDATKILSTNAGKNKVSKIDRDASKKFVRRRRRSQFAESLRFDESVGKNLGPMSDAIFLQRC